MASEGDAQYEASDESSENELLDKSLSVWKGLGWNVKETFEPIPLDLHTASSIGHFDCVRNFISRKVDLNKKNRGGWTPLMYAAYIGHDNIVNLLLDAGVNVNIKNHKGQTPLMLASTCGNESVSYFICQQGAELEARDNKGWTALFHSTYAGHQNMVRFLLEQGANINSVEPSKGMTPFMEAAAEGHEIIVQIFLQHGVNVNTKAHNGDTARSLALIHGHMKVVSLIDNHILPITCLRSEAGLDANLSSSDESFPVKRPTSARDKRGKGKGPSIRDGPDAIAKLIDRSSIPKGYVSVQQGETTQDGGQKISYREVTSPINPQDFSLESSKDSCDIDQDEDGNAFSQTGALTIKSSSGSSGGLAAAFGINREGSVDSDDYHPQDSLTSNTSQSDCHSSLGGSRNSLNNSPEPYEGGCGKSYNDMNIVTGADGYGSVEGGQRKGLRKESTEPELRQMKGSKQGGQLTNGGISNSLGCVAPPPGFQPLPQNPLPVQIGDMESSIIDQRKINEAFEITDTGEDNSAPFPERNTGRSSVVRGENLHQAAESRSSVKETGQPNAKTKHPSVDFMIGNTPIKESRSQEFPESSARGQPQEGDKPRYPPQSVPGAKKHGQQQQQQHQQKRQQPQQQHLSQHPHPQHSPQLHHHHQSQSMEAHEVHRQYQDSNFPARQLQSVSNAVATPGHHTNSSVPVMSPMGSGTVPQTNVAVCPPIGYQLFPNGATLNPNMVNNATTKGGSKPPIPSQHMPKTVNQSCVNPSAHSAMKPQGNQHGGHMTGQGGSHSGHPGKAAPPGGVGQMPGQQTTASSVPSLNMLQDQGFFRAQKSVTNGYPDSLQELLDQLGLLKYLAVFEEQDVDLQVFLSLTDADLKEVGIKLFGPRKKMINAISRWHNQGPSVVEGNVEQAYANRMQLEMQEVSVQLQKAYREVEKLKAQVLQEQRIRTVTENCLTDIQRVSYDTKQKCEEMKESLKKLKYYHSEVRGKMAPNRKRQPASSSETQLLSDLTHAIKEDLSMEDSGAGQDNLSASANLIIRKIEHHLLDLSHSIKMITINADKLLSWGVNSQHETSYS